jgi:hypothetical protein
MNHYAGLDVSLDETSVCVVDEAEPMPLKPRWRATPWRLPTIFTRPG